MHNLFYFIKQMCREKCWLDDDIFEYGCVQRITGFPHKERLCEENKGKECALIYLKSEN